MSLRVVLAVALSVAILGVAVPGVDRAAEKRTADAIRTEVGAVTDAGDSLLERDELTPGESPGARRVVTVSLPARSWHAAGVDYLALAGPPPDEAREGSARPGRVTYRLKHGPRRTVPVAVPLAPTAGRAVVLREAGAHRLVLSLGTRNGDRVVLVERADRRRTGNRTSVVDETDRGRIGSRGLSGIGRPGPGMRVIDRLRSADDSGEQSPGGVPGCGCEPRFEDGRLVVDADDCQSRGDLVDSEACRATAVGALTDRDAEVVLVRSRGLEWTYRGPGGTLLVAAGRFAAAIEPHDARLADLARRDPLRAARDAAARSTPASRLAAETGLILAAEAAGCESVVDPLPDYGDVLDPFVGPAMARSRIGRPPADGRLRSARELDTDGVARVYDTDTGPLYHLEPVEARFDHDEATTLADARERLGTGNGVARSVDDQGRIPRDAVAAVAGDRDPVETIARVLEKHTRGYGVLTDLFADPRVSDVFATAPVEENPLRVVVDGQPMRTNVWLTADGARTLASRLRRESGRAFSRAAPTLDATAETDHGRIRVAGLSDPASDGVAFAFRDHGRRAWTLPGLVENGTLTPRVAGFLSVAVERDAAGLVAGTRGAGKTTLLGALLWELPPATRTVVIEDTPELPVDALTDAGRDVQGIRTSLDDGPSIPPTEALRTALRLGDGALVLGEVRGEEAAVLYEAMRVGASANATLGTIHGDGADAVRERVVSDLEVPASSFAATDLVATVRRQSTPSGPSRQVGSVEEVVADGEDVGFAPLFEPGADGARPTGRADRGDSVLVSELSRPGESYADVLTAVEDRAESLSAMARRGRTDAGTVARAYASKRR